MGDRLSYRPSSAEEEIDGLRVKLLSAYERVKTLKNRGQIVERGIERQKQNTTARNPNEVGSDLTLPARQAMAYPSSFIRVIALLEDATAIDLGEVHGDSAPANSATCSMHSSGIGGHRGIGLE
jgi:hypothetical protein